MSAATQAPPDAGLAEFTAAIEEFSRAQRRVQGRFNRAPAVPELSKAQYLLLEVLLDGGGSCVGELADAAGVSPPTATRMLDGLARRDIVTRTADERDRRIVRIALTAHGRELMEAKHAEVQAARAAVFASLPAGERAGAARLLRHLAAAIEELRP